MSRSRLIVVLGSLALVGLAAMSWFLVLSPRLGQSEEIQTQSESVRDQTSRLEREIAQLTALQGGLPARVARLEELKATFPSTAELPAVLDQIRAAAGQAGVSIQALETLAPELVVPAAAATGATPDATAGATTDATSPTAPAAGAQGESATPADPANPADGSVGLPTAEAADGTLATMAMSVTVSGSYASLSAFLGATELLPRAWLVDAIKAQGGQQGGEEITLTASGSMFVLDTTGIAVPPAAPGTGA